MMTLMHRVNALVTRRFDVFAFVAIAGVGLLLWLPFGFNVGFWADEWPTWAALEDGQAKTNFASRPFVLVPHWIAHTLTPDSFIGLNLVVFALIALRGIAVYGWCAALLRDRRLAAIAGVLTIIYPADTATFNLGVVGVHFALTTLISGAALAWTLRGGWSIACLSAGWALAVASLLTYETGYPLFMLLPLALLLHRPPGWQRRWIVIALVWWSAALISGGRLVLLAQQNPELFSYQQGMIAPPPLTELIIAALRYVEHLLIGGWWYNAPVFTTWLPWALIGAVPTALLTASGPVSLRLTGRRGLIVLMGAAAAMIVGFFPFLLTTLHLNFERTLLYASVGAAILIAALICQLVDRIPVRRGQTVLTAGLVGMLVALSLTVLLEQHATFDRLADSQIRTLREVTVLARGADLATTGILLIDDAGGAHATAFIPSSYYLRMAWQVITHPQAGPIAFCLPGAIDWGITVENCTFGAAAVEMRSPAGDFIVPYDRLIALRFQPDGTLERLTDLSAYGVTAPYDPLRLIDETAPLPRRAITLLGLSGDR